MNTWIDYLFVICLGAGLSLFLVAGLWWTLQRVQQGRWPRYGLLISYWVRLAVVALGFVAVARTAGWRGVLVATVAFAASRPFWVHGLARHTQ